MRKTCAVDWNQLRSEDSVYTSFERLCSQVAKLKKPSSDAEFISNGDPDGGVDCYWKLDNSDIHAWQAKFFRRLGTTQWNQIDESVQNALKNYPKLTKYVICLPLNLSNSGKNSARQKWESHKKKWLEQKPNVEVLFECKANNIDKSISGSKIVSRRILLNSHVMGITANNIAANNATLLLNFFPAILNTRKVSKTATSPINNRGIR